jgi:voltage-gated sodium channel
MIAWCRTLAHAHWFQRFILATILLAAVVVGLETSPQLMAVYGPWLHAIDRVVLAIFAAEVAIKLLARAPRWWTYFADPWNVFDFIIVAVCFLPAAHAPFAAVLRLARIVRVLRLVTALPKLQILVGALLKSLPSMGYVGLLLGLLFYIYGVLGVNLFGAADTVHFGTLGRTLLTLFQIVTLEGWADLMRPLAEGGHAWSAPAYFVSFILLGTMIMLNLFIGVIMNGMTEAHAEQTNARQAAEGETPQLVTALDAIKRDLDALRARVEAARVLSEHASSRPEN